MPKATGQPKKDGPSRVTVQVTPDTRDRLAELAERKAAEVGRAVSLREIIEDGAAALEERRAS